MGIEQGRRFLLPGCALCLSALAAHCGARTPLFEWSERGDAGAFEDAATDVGTDSIAPEAALDAAPTACPLVPVGEPVEILSLPDQDLHTPSMAVIDPGNPSAPAPARVALQTVGGAIRLVALTVHQPTPAGTVVESNAPISLGGGMTYAQMVHAPGELRQLALVWGADGPGNVFRAVDIPSWTPGAPVQVATTGWTPNGLAAGMGFVHTQSGQYEGWGYGMTWQGGKGAAAWVAVLSPEGELRIGPLATSAPVGSDMLESSISWSGSTYLMATRFKGCTPGDALCRERAVVVTRLRLKPGSNSIEFASSFEMGTPSWSPGYPTLDGVFMVFDEGPDSAEARVVHVEELDENGNPVGPDHVVSSTARPLARPFIGSTPTGKLVGWTEDGDGSKSDHTLGRSRVVVQGLDASLGHEGPQLELPISRYGSMGHPVAVPLEHPRGVLLAWSARSRTSPRNAIFVQFLPCGG